MFVVSPKLLTAAFLCSINTSKAFSQIHNIFAHASVMAKALSSCSHMACMQISLHLCFRLSESFGSTPLDSRTVPKLKKCLCVIKDKHRWVGPAWMVHMPDGGSVWYGRASSQPRAGLSTTSSTPSASAAAGIQEEH